MLWRHHVRVRLHLVFGVFPLEYGVVCFSFDLKMWVIRNDLILWFTLSVLSIGYAC